MIDVALMAAEIESDTAIRAAMHDHSHQMRQEQQVRCSSTYGGKTGQGGGHAS